ncbi:hypothetical protein FJ444_03620 [Aestuariibacter sp. GS-14]|uniref:FFLEELY motif protein n=1 Tax=Aestuariibacter sp. GS-14 TaxID=2590670 RepID=UPI00112EBE7E|nr:hypothetical protein [Aestuariibacter sp. GS-14]TPV60723.1 hypothetical protein FJ444_03620 [Aestuariibacter sp. GS-14]
MTDSLIAHLRQVNARRQLAQQMGILEDIQAVQRWQCKRLLSTHAKMASQADYHDAITFFVDELYGPKDFSQRDADLIRVIPKLAKALPNKAMVALDNALMLNALSFELDMAVAQHLDNTPLNRDTYAMAYRSVSRADDRATQIAIVASLGEQLADVVKIPGVGLIIKLSRRPAKMAGLLALHDFLYRGFSAFKGLGDVKAFIEPVIAAETELNAALLDARVNLTTDNPLPDV